MALDQSEIDEMKAGFYEEHQNRITELETELAEAQKMRDFYQYEGSLDLGWGRTEKARGDQRDLWAKAWKVECKYWQSQAIMRMRCQQSAEAELTKAHTMTDRLTAEVGTLGKRVKVLRTGWDDALGEVERLRIAHSGKKSREIISDLRVQNTALREASEETREQKMERYGVGEEDLDYNFERDCL